MEERFRTLLRAYSLIKNASDAIDILREAKELYLKKRLRKADYELLHDMVKNICELNQRKWGIIMEPIYYER